MFKKVPTVYSKDYDLAIMWSDIHIPYHDQKLTSVLLDVIEDLQPSLCIDGGDLINATQLSGFQKTHDQLTGLQQELYAAHAWLESVNLVSPKSKKIILTDNHFWRRVNDKILKENYGLSDLACLTPESLLRLDDFGWKSMKEWNWKDVLLACHGDDIAGSSVAPINTVRKLVANNSISIIRCHSHSTGMEMYSHYGNRIVAGVQLGTLHDRSRIDYVKHNSLHNWTASFLLIYLNKKTDEFFLNPVYFVNNKVMINGKIYK